MCSRKHGYIHGYSTDVRLIQANAKVSLAAQQQKYKHANVNKARFSWK